MKCLVLPGFSVKNKQWALDVKNHLGADFPASVISWTHWETGKPEPDWITWEADKIASTYSGPVNIIAKSIGTAVAMSVIGKNSRYVDKIIFCGLPVSDLQRGDEQYYEPLTRLSPEKFICFQNSHDNHGSYQQAETFIHSLNPNLRIVSRPRSDHEYPYFTDFVDFFKK